MFKNGMPKIKMQTLCVNGPYSVIYHLQKTVSYYELIISIPVSSAINLLLLLTMQGSIVLNVKYKWRFPRHHGDRASTVASAPLQMSVQSSGGAIYLMLWPQLRHCGFLSTASL